MTRVAITGAAGAIGRLLARELAGDYDLRLSDVVVPAGAPASFLRADVADPAQAAAALKGADAVVHLGGIRTEAPFDRILRTNIVGTYNVFEAARRLGVKRVVLPSSNQVVGYYPKRRDLPTAVTPRPSGWYGVGKVFAESVGALYADKYGLRVLAIRIGRYAPLPEDVRGLSIWIGGQDLVQLVRIGLEHPDIHFDVVYGVSDDARSFFDNSRAYELGYRPAQRAEDHVDHAYAHEGDRPPIGPIGDRFIGGRLAARDYAGDPSRSGT